MNYALILFTVFFAILGMVFAFSPVVSFSIFKINKKKMLNDNIDTDLELFEKSKSSEEKAKYFISLMKLSYVLIHVMQNHGGKYNDKKQEERFKSSLTKEAIEKIKKLGE